MAPTPRNTHYSFFVDRTLLGGDPGRPTGLPRLPQPCQRTAADSRP
jgi:hypothetical protein